MCYSTSNRKKREELQQALLRQSYEHVYVPEDYAPFFHRNGFTHGDLYVITMEEPQKVNPAAWGLVPHWAQHDAEAFWKKSNTLNAKSETIFEKPSYRDSAHEGRCLVLTDGFFEPHHENGVAIPYFCYQPTKAHPEGDLFLFAGLYTELDDGRLTTTILTTDANDFFAEVHNQKKRMPLVLNNDVLEDWLDDGYNEQQLNEIIATGFTQLPFEAHPISRDLYKKGIDTNQPYIVEKVEKGTLF
ncbi:MAG: SOS response-associated peptidase [Flavobacteriaceae bacterium]|nr:SOS response-associated peptidase [Flavobacteriaceae bacterium]